MAIPKKNKAEEEPSPGLHLSERYPDPAVEVLDPTFAKYRIFNAAVERLASGMRATTQSFGEFSRLPQSVSKER
jgi:hypothetical protein